jgi:hypothetical protein
MFSKLISVIRGTKSPTLPKPVQPDSWDAAFGEVVHLLDGGKYNRAEAVLRNLLHSDLSDDYKITASYYTGVMLLRKGELEAARQRLEETVNLAKILGKTEKMISPLNLWAKSLEMQGDGETQAVCALRQQHVEACAELDHLAWSNISDSDDVVHTATGIRFPTSFGSFTRAERSFENTDGLDGIIFYRVPPPQKSWARIQIMVTSLSPKDGLRRLSDEALFWLKMGDASFKEGTFEAGGQTGIRRLWPFIEKGGELWALETFFVPFGDIHIAILLANGPDFDPDDNRALLAQFDWPRTQ